MVTETVAGTFSYGLACSAGSQSAQSKTTVIFSPQPHGGGGAFDEFSLMGLLSVLGVRVVRNRAAQSLMKTTMA
jgi:hypothetical protein